MRTSRENKNASWSPVRNLIDMKKVKHKKSSSVFKKFNIDHSNSIDAMNFKVLALKKNKKHMSKVQYYK
jgi:hypothetical protein